MDRETKRFLIIGLLPLIIIIISMLTTAITSGLYGGTNDIVYAFFLFLFRYIEITSIFWILITGIFVTICKAFFRPKDEKTINFLKKGYIFSFIIAIIIVNYVVSFDEYAIDNKKVYGIQMLVNVAKDITNKNTVVIKSNTAFVLKDSATSRNSSIGFVRIDYLNIDDNKYVIPIGNEDVVESLLYKNTYGKKSENVIEVYENSKLIKSINGIELTENINIINEFVSNKEYIIDININKYGIITYEIDGCTLEEFRKNQKYPLSLQVYDKTFGITFGYDVKNYDNINEYLEDGMYDIVVKSGFSEKSNHVTIKIKDGLVYKVK